MRGPTAPRSGSQRLTSGNLASKRKVLGILGMHQRLRIKARNSSTSCSSRLGPSVSKFAFSFLKNLRAAGFPDSPGPAAPSGDRFGPARVGRLGVSLHLVRQTWGHIANLGFGSEMLAELRIGARAWLRGRFRVRHTSSVCLKVMHAKRRSAAKLSR